MNNSRTNNKKLSRIKQMTHLQLSIKSEVNKKLTRIRCKRECMNNNFIVVKKRKNPKRNPSKKNQLKISNLMIKKMIKTKK